MQIKEKLPKTIQMWLCVGGAGGCGSATEAALIAGGGDGDGDGKCVNASFIWHIKIWHNHAYRILKFQWRQLKWINRWTKWNPCKLIGH